jgi:pyridoxine 5-phosphate synthase
MPYLGVNIDHVATLRQVRRTQYPDPVEIARVVERAGAHGITVHLREDRRHIQEEDVRRLRAVVSTLLNMELALNEEIINIALDIKPDEVCIVPERRAELTTEGGLDVASQKEKITRAVERFHKAGIRVSLFIDPDPIQIQAAHEVQARIIELHTGKYAEAKGEEQDHEWQRLADAAKLAHSLGLQVNAGHGLHYTNTARIVSIPYIHTLNIGHSIISRALTVGIEQAVKEMLAIIQQGSPHA